MRKHIFLAGWEVQLNGDQDCDNFIATQITTQEVVQHIYYGLELVFENDRLVQAFDYEQGDKEERELGEDEIGLPYPDYEPNRLADLRHSPDGLHQIGGEIPDGFTLPEGNWPVPFQYLGYISNRDENFSWLPCTIHLACPIYLEVGYVFLDYSNELAPTVINREDVEQAGNPYNGLGSDLDIVFEAETCELVEVDEPGSGPGHTGIPFWIHYPDIPMCPRSGKRMKFLCQLGGGAKVARSNAMPDSRGHRPHPDQLTFWGDGELFVFFEPTARTACYFIRCT